MILLTPVNCFTCWAQVTSTVSLVASPLMCRTTKVSEPSVVSSVSRRAARDPMFNVRLPPACSASTGSGQVNSNEIITTSRNLQVLSMLKKNRSIFR